MCVCIGFVCMCIIIIIIIIIIIDFYSAIRSYFRGCKACVRVQISDFDSSSEDDDDEESDSDSSGCEWETEEEELLAADSSSRFVQDNPAFSRDSERMRDVPKREPLKIAAVGFSTCQMEWLPLHSFSQEQSRAIFVGRFLYQSGVASCLSDSPSMVIVFMSIFAVGCSKTFFFNSHDTFRCTMPSCINYQPKGFCSRIFLGHMFFGLPDQQ